MLSPKSLPTLQRSTAPWLFRQSSRSIGKEARLGSQCGTTARPDCKNLDTCGLLHGHGNKRHTLEFQCSVYTYLCSIQLCSLCSKTPTIGNDVPVDRPSLHLILFLQLCLAIRMSSKHVLIMFLVLCWCIFPEYQQRADESCY